ncbi:hypothetical protein PISL3812_03941 [Talaromyces islandicus]|uniref:Histone deacetylase complex subunit SAP30 Sin3 binding domain-containing protein n=1 Tax=Talaromyces islandicus TaxID=28573 RepID=A0A0U1LU41_TALIS|nr:hypothetical protein PISL3812_03941 [Talaromyces islandicus]
MPPPRQRPADDSRSEASSGTAAAGANSSRQPSGPKSRKVGNSNTSAAAGQATGAGKDLKVAAAANAAAAAAAAAGTTTGSGVGQSGDDALPSIAWSQMPLSLLHDYRHAHKLATPSAYARPISRLLLSSGVGLRSPTAIAARRAAVLSSSSSTSSSSSGSTANQNTSGNSNGNGNGNRNTNDDSYSSTFSRPHNKTQKLQGQKNKKDVLKQIPSQNRIAKDQLALAVRKHFNAAGLVEQEAIARFLYKVREEGKGREFRLRFQP